MVDWIYNSFLSPVRFCWGFVFVAADLVLAVFRDFDSVFVVSFRLFDDYFVAVVVVYFSLTSIIK